MIKHTDIKAYMKSKGIRQSHVAKNIGISSVSLNMILNGKRKLEVNEYRLICMELDVPLEFFDNYIETKNC